MSDWIQLLKQNIEQEFGERPAVITLATVREEQNQSLADARVVLVRRVLDDGTLLMTSDARSEKNAQLRRNSSATAVFWLGRLRKQFIVDGTVEILSGSDSSSLRADIWRSSSDATRAMFYWPASGRPFDDSEVFCEAVDANAAIPQSFEVLLLHPRRVEMLDLNPRPHSRMIWSEGDGVWRGERVNP